MVDERHSTDGEHRALGRADRLADPPEKHAQELAAARTYLEAQGIDADYHPAIGEPA